MEHNQAIALKAPERYLLNEMSEPERFDFEDHYFRCEECAEDVRVGAAMARGVYAVGAEDFAAHQTRPGEAASKKNRFLNWLMPSSLVPAFASAAFAVLAGYQAFVIIPSLREASSPRMIAPVVLRAAARGDEPVIVFDTHESISGLAMDVNAGRPGEPLTWQVVSPEGKVAMQGTSAVPAAGSQLMLELPRGKVARAGSWTLSLRTPEGTIGEYPFRVDLK